MSFHAVADRHPSRSEPNDVVPVFLLLTAAAFLLDWTTKSWALHNVSHTYVPLGSLTLGVARNEGFAFSAGSGMISPWVVVIARLAVLAVLAFFAFRVAHRTRTQAVGLGMLFAGGLGNAADLAFRGGAVVDFIGAGPYLVPMRGELFYMHVVFNVADVLIVVGLLMCAPLIRVIANQLRGRGTAAAERATTQGLSGPRRV